MAIGAKTLAQGQLAVAKTTIYTCPALTKTYVSGLVVFNTGSVDESVVVYVKMSGGTSRVWDHGVVGPSESGEVRPVVLAAGDVIEAMTTTATTVDYTITGAEES